MFWFTLGGSLFLYNRKVVKHFRNDGHNWRKNKDGKTLQESHGKLMVCIVTNLILLTNSVLEIKL